MSASLDRFTDGANLRMGCESGEVCPEHGCEYRVGDLGDYCPQCRAEEREEREQEAK